MFDHYWEITLNNVEEKNTSITRLINSTKPGKRAHEKEPFGSTENRNKNSRTCYKCVSVINE